MMLFRNTSAFFLAVCTFFSFLTCPIVGQPPPKPPLPPPLPPPPLPCGGNEVAFVMRGCPNAPDGANDRLVFRTEIEQVYGPHDCIDISSPGFPSQSDLEAYDIIIVEGSSVYDSDTGRWIFDYTVQMWLSVTGNTALVNLATAGKKVFFNAAEYKGADSRITFPAAVYIEPFVRSWETTLTPTSPQLDLALNDPDGSYYHTFNPLFNLPADAITLMKIDGKCGSTRKACSGTQLAQLPSSGGLLLGTVQTSFKYKTPAEQVQVRSDLRKSIYTEYMCPVSAFCGTTSMTVNGEIVLECCDEANNLVGKACCGPNPYDPVLQVCCSDDAVVNAGTDCDCA